MNFDYYLVSNTIVSTLILTNVGPKYNCFNENFDDYWSPV